MRAVVAPAGREGAGERLRRDLLREFDAHAPLRVGVHGRVVTLEDGAERRRLVERAADRVCVGGRHVIDCPRAALGSMFVLGSRDNEPDRGHRARRDGGEPGTQHRTSRRADRRPQPDGVEDERLHGGVLLGGRLHGSRDAGGVRLGARAPATHHRHGQGGQARGRRDRRPRTAARQGRHHHRRRQLALRRHAPARVRADRAGTALHRHRRLGRRGGRSERPVDHAGRPARGLRRGRGDLHHDRRAGRRRAVLRLHRRRRRGPLREDGPQRHRVRRHAADRRGVRPAALRHRARRAGDQGDLRRVERGRPRVVPDRDHRHRARQDRRARPASRWWT